ncbi:MAG TPA: glycosyltransferase family 4 protein [Candidatus Ozemobacteraceae bacterium]|nr:glycosyltransferase family 4 protein [Candidatus Ozemobacteraceae bacterium]
MVEYLFILGRYLAALVMGRPGTVYITLNQSVDGMCRDLFLMKTAFMAGCRVVVHIHGGCYDTILRQAPGILRNGVVRALARCDTVILLSERLRGMFDQWPEVQRRCRTLPNGLPFEPVGCPDEPKSLPGDRPVRLLYLSNMIESKGWPVVLEAVERLVHHHGLSVRVKFCGAFMSAPEDRRFASPAEAKAWFDTYVGEHGMKDVVEYREHVGGEEKIRVLQEAHLLLLPSSYPNEGQPLTLIEGLAYGCVLVGTPYRAIPDMVVESETGLLLPPDPDLVAAGIANLLKNPARYRAMSEAALKLFKRDFHAAIHVERLMRILAPPAGESNGGCAAV